MKKCPNCKKWIDGSVFTFCCSYCEMEWNKASGYYNDDQPIPDTDVMESEEYNLLLPKRSLGACAGALVAIILTVLLALYCFLS